MSIHFQDIKISRNGTYAGEEDPGGVPVWGLGKGIGKLGVEPCELDDGRFVAQCPNRWTQ